MDNFKSMVKEERPVEKMKKKIVYYHGCVVDYFDHKTGRAVLELLERGGCEVEVPELICCSFPLLHAGEFQLAQKRAIKLTRILADFVESGYKVVYSCPTCGHALTETYPKLLKSETARLVAENTYFISSLLLELLEGGERDLEFRNSPAKIAYHTPCHLRSQELSTESIELLKVIPGLEIEHIDRGCCGMGGTWALRSHQRGEISAGVGVELFNEIQEKKPQIVTTDCFSCGIQIARYTGLIPVHPLHILLDALS
jgi:glycerol-3-phosphate dehydrogenase subunit C